MSEDFPGNTTFDDAYWRSRLVSTLEQRKAEWRARGYGDDLSRFDLGTVERDALVARLVKMSDANKGGSSAAATVWLCGLVRAVEYGETHANAKVFK